MPPNKQGRKQRTRGKNNSNIIRDRSVTIAENPASAPPYMLPSQTPFASTLGNMFAPFHHHQQGQQQQPGVSISDMPGFQFQQQPNMMHPFSGQGSAFYNPLQQAFHTQNQQPVPQQQQPQQQNHQQNSGDVSDLEKLRKLKQTILAGQHPFFQPNPNPDALASLYLGPHPTSQAYKEQNQQQQSTQPSASAGTLSQSQSENTKATPGPHKPNVSSQPSNATILNATKRPQTPSPSLGPGVSRASGSLPTPQSIPPGAFDHSGVHQQAQSITNGSVGLARNDNSSDKFHPNVPIAPKNQDFRTSTPSPLPPSSAKSSVPFPPQQHPRGPLTVHSSGASGANQQQSRVPPVSAGVSTAPLNDNAGANKPLTAANDAKDGSHLYKDLHPDAPPSGGFDRDRERDRPGYPPSDRREFGRYGPRYPDPRYDRDRDWGRSRDWEGDRDREREREREKERERDKDRRRVEDKPLEERRLEYESSGRPHMDRRPPPPPSAGTNDQKPLVLDQRPVPGHGPLPEQRRPEVPVHSEQARSDVPPHPEQQPRHPDTNLPRAMLPPPPSSVEQRRPEPAIPPYTNQSHNRDRSRVSQGPQGPRPGPPPSAGPPLPHRDEPRPIPASTATDDRSGPRSVPPDQRALPGTNTTRSGPPSPEMNRRPEPVSSIDRNTGRPPAGGSVDDTDTSRSVTDRRLSHSRDPPLPRTSESRPGQGPGQDDHAVPRPFYPSATGSAAPRGVSRGPSPGPRRPVDSSYDAPRDRDRAVSLSSTPYREPPPPPAAVASRGYTEDLRRQSLETHASRRVSDNYYTSTPPPVSPVIDRREPETRQWRERESYPPAPYLTTDTERERARRYPEMRDWPNDAYTRERDGRGDLDMPTRGRPPPPASWDRDRPIAVRDKEKERDRFGNWTNTERKYPGPDTSTGPPPSPSRWDDPASHPHRPLHSRLSDTYDDRFIPRDAAERARYPPPSLNEDTVMREGYRENPRVRPRSPSPSGRPSGVFDDAHRAPKRAREEFGSPSRPQYYDVRRGGASEYPHRGASPPPYYDPREPALANPRDPSPYSRDRTSDPYARRDMPPPRTPPYYPRDRYPPR